MRRIFQATALVVLTLWVPMTVHCSLETLFDWPAEDCCHDQASDASTPAEHCAVEDGGYRLTGTSVVVAAPDLLLCWCADVVSALPPATEPIAISEHSESPPELMHTWQFTARTALPARAPSHVS